MTRLLVTGTDTEVGKTIVSAGLVAAWRRRGLKARGWKPVESGTEATGEPVDATLLRRVSGGTEDAELPVVYALPEPLAPVLAARRRGVVIVPAVLDAGFRAASEGADAFVVEGAGGALVEAAEGLMFADLPARWGLDVLVVAANRLGVLSHTLLTVEALQRRSVRVRGVVLNTMHAGEPSVAEATNADELARLLPESVPLLGVVPWLTPEHRGDPDHLADALDPIADQLERA